MKALVILPEIEIHTTPLEEIFMDSHTINIFLDDINEHRHKITANPYQAMHVTTIDCVSSENYYNEFCFREGRYHRHILQIEDSPIIKKLKQNLVESENNFLNNVKHYALPLQDIIIDMIVSGLTVNTV